MQCAGDMFLAMASECSATDPKLSSFSVDLGQHLTELNLRLQSETGYVHHLNALGLLTALQKLELGCFNRNEWYREDCDLAGEKAVWKLPHLVSLCMYELWQFRVVLSCPKMTKADFDRMEHLHVEAKHAALRTLILDYCNDLRYTLHSPEDQLQNLTSLVVLGCSEDGRHLIEDVSCMKQIQELEYKRFPAACMPAKFPQSLQDLILMPLSWARNLPGG